MSVTLPTSFLVLLAQLVEARSGLHYPGQDLERFRERVLERTSDAGFESVIDYYYALRYDDPGSVELDRLIESLLVGETYFFRERPALDALIELIRPVVARGERARVWSAACATGEEPVTLAILLQQAGLRHAVDIVATDISERALDRARRGEYGLRAHRALGEEATPWIRVADGRAMVDDRIRASIQWQQVNLRDRAKVASLGVFDAILCRNVLIYFSDDTIREVADNLAATLRPGGYLLVGVSESLLRFGTTFSCEEHLGTFFYRLSEA